MKRLAGNDLATAMKQALVDYLHNIKFDTAYAQDILDTANEVFPSMKDQQEKSFEWDFSLILDKEMIDYESDGEEYELEVIFNKNISNVNIYVLNDEGSQGIDVEIAACINDEEGLDIWYCFNKTIEFVELMDANELAAKLNNLVQTVTIDDIYEDWQ